MVRALFFIVPRIWENDNAPPGQAPDGAALEGSDVGFHALVGVGGGEGGLHDLEDPADLRQLDQGLRFAADGFAEVAVELMDVGDRAVRFVDVQGDVVPGGHGLGDAGGHLLGEDVLLVPGLQLGDFGVFPPVHDLGGAVFALHVEPGEGEEVIGAQLDAGFGAVGEENPQVEAVVYLVVGVVGGFAPDADDLVLAAGDLEELVDHVDAPVQHHAAAVLLVAAPVAGDAPGAVDPGLDVQEVADLAAVGDFFHGQEVHVPAAVLVDGEKLAALFGGVGHFVKGCHGHFHGLFTDDVFARFQGADDQLLVAVVGGDDGDGLDAFVGQDLLKGIVTPDARLPDLLLLHGVDVVNAGKLRHVAFQKLAAVPLALSAVADDGDSGLFHKIVPFCPENRKPPEIPGELLAQKGHSLLAVTCILTRNAV